MENKEWSDANKTKVYKITVPPGLSASHVSVNFSTATGIMFVSADTKFFKSRWNNVLVYDYRKAKWFQD